MLHAIQVYMLPQPFETLKILWETGGNQVIDALLYAIGLVNLTTKQSAEGVEAVVGRLQELHERVSEHKGIALRYAKGLVNLSDKQMIDEISETIQRLEKFYSRYSDNEEMTVAYAMGLLNLAEKQPAQEVQSIIPKIESLCQKYPENKESKEILNALEKL